MSQSEILDILESAKEPLGLSEISKKCYCNKITVSHSLARLIKSKRIKIVEIDRFEAKKRFNSPRRVRLYFV